MYIPPLQQIIPITLIVTFSLLSLLSPIHTQTCFGHNAGSLTVCSGPRSAEAARCDTTNYGQAVAAGYECYSHVNAAQTEPIRGVCAGNNYCQCYNGWGGYNCALAKCSDILYSDPNVCSGHGTCAGPNSCRCWPAGGPTATTGSPLYEGDNCEYPTCNGIISTNPRVCNGRAIVTYTNPVKTGCYEPNRCDCNNLSPGTLNQDSAWGYGGSDCEVLFCNNDASPSQCGGPTRGTCVVKTDATTIGGRNRCQCKDGWASANDANDYGVCNQAVCYGKRANGEDGAPCSGHGTCDNPDTCSCSGIWTGSNCDIWTCQAIAYTSPTVCNSRGTCENTGLCTGCRAGWKNGAQNNCEIKECNSIEATDPGVCSGHGLCNPNNTYADDNKCFCTGGYEGTWCDAYRCFGVLSSDSAACSGHGSCDDYNTCTCDPTKYAGSQCEIPVCFGIAASDSTVCSNGQGTCTAPDTCACAAGWTGAECQTPICSGTPATSGGVCSSRGTCTLPDKCVCNSGYVGFTCELVMCYTRYSNDPQVCGGHGTCVSPHTCSCSDSTKWAGAQCNIPKCFGIRADDANVCNGHGSCSAPDTCVCSGPGWSGAQCQTSVCVDRTTSCSGHGSCNSDNTACICDTNYATSDCSMPVCYGKYANDTSVCSAHGTCDGPNQCSCFDYTYSGSECQLPGCYGVPATDTANICGGTNGTCIAVDQCQCVTNIGYLNSKCENPGCFGAGSDANLVCSQHGECVGVDDCVCNPGWGGADCSRPRCFGLPFAHAGVCSSHGQCTYADTCECESDYTGNNCQYPSCFGVEGSDPYVCAAHGTCVAPNVCQCFNTSSYSGYNCEQPGCFGVRANDANVCYGRGECVAEDTCLCEVHAGIGSNCEVNVCFGINATDARVCNRRGDCVLPDTCDCNTGYGGAQCEQHYCFGISHTNSTVCNGQGSCTAVDTCVCSATHMGSQCQYPACNGVLEYDYCNGHGKCANLTQCSCDENYYGEYCTKMYEICPNSHTIGTIDAPCSSCTADADNGLTACPTFVSAKWDLVEQRSGAMTLTGFYKVPDRPLDGTLEIDCVKVFSQRSLPLLGDFASCQWDAINSDKFVVTLGRRHRVESSTMLEFNMLPFDSDVQLFSSSQADTSSSKTPVPDTDLDGPQAPGSASGDNGLWIAGIVVPASLIVILSCIICCLVCAMGCCVLIALRPRKRFKVAHDVDNYFVDPKMQAQIEEFDHIRRQRELEERRERRRLRLAELNKEQDNLEEERKLREFERREQQVQDFDAKAEEARLEEEKLKLEKAKYGHESDRFTYEWDPITRRYVERLVDDDGARINHEAFDMPSGARLGTVVDQAMLRSQFAPQSNTSAANASDDNIGELLFAFENGILSRSLANRSLGWVSKTRDKLHGGGGGARSPSPARMGASDWVNVQEARPSSALSGGSSEGAVEHSDQERLLSENRR